MADPKNPKPHIKLAATLVMLGMSLFMLERFGLSWLSSPGQPAAHLDGTLISVLVIAPMVLIIGGCLVFAIGTMMRPR